MTHEQLLAHGKFLQRLARSLVADQVEADDLVQRTWLSAMEARPGEVRSTRAWLKTIALNVVRGDHRRQETKARCALPQREAASDPAELFLRKQTTQQLVQVVFELPETEREVVLLRFFEDLKPGEIAKHLKIPRETVRTRLRRGLQRLRMRLDAEHGGDRSAWALALAPFAGLRSQAGLAVTSGLAPAVALSLGSAKVAMLVGIVVLVLAGTWFINREEPLDFEVEANTSVAMETERREPTRATVEKPSPKKEAPKKTKETKEVSAVAVAPEKEETEEKPEEILCNVVGRAVDQRGESIADARIELCSTNGPMKRIAVVYSDDKGYFQFDERVVPPQREGRLNGTIIVFGTAPGFGFAWHGMRSVLAGKRPADRQNVRDDSHYRGEECVMNLVFPSAQTVEGLVVDENGAPVPDVVASLVSCDFIDREGKPTHVNYREFWGIDFLPEDRRKATTDGQGRFKIPNLPREMLLTFFLRHPERATKTTVVVTTDRDPKTLKLNPNIVGPEGVLFEKSPLRIVMPSTRRMTVRCVHPSSQAPIAAARVSAFRRGADRQASYGRTNPQGEVLLQLPKGKFRVCVDPPADSELVRTYHEIEVAREPLDQEITLKLDPAAIVILEVVDAVTKAPIPGVAFDNRSKGAPRMLQSHPGIVDNPTTDEEGRLRVLMTPGSTRITIGYTPTPGYQRSSQDQKLELRAGETHTLRFELMPTGN